MPRSVNNCPDRIAQRAFELWQNDGRPEGRSLEYWLAAEQELAAVPTGRPQLRNLGPSPSKAAAGKHTVGKSSLCTASESLIAILPLVV